MQIAASHSEPVYIPMHFKFYSLCHFDLVTTRNARSELTHTQRTMENTFRFGPEATAGSKRKLKEGKKWSASPALVAYLASSGE